MPFTATVIGVEKREEAFSVSVRFNNNVGAVITTRIINFPASATKTFVQAEIQKFGNSLLSVDSGAADVETLINIPVTIVPAVVIPS